MNKNIIEEIKKDLADLRKEINKNEFDMLMQCELIKKDIEERKAR